MFDFSNQHILFPFTNTCAKIQKKHDFTNLMNTNITQKPDKRHEIRKSTEGHFATATRHPLHSGAKSRPNYSPQYVQSKVWQSSQNRTPPTHNPSTTTPLPEAPCVSVQPPDKPLCTHERYYALGYEDIAA
jgi:hypothetical protein